MYEMNNPQLVKWAPLSLCVSPIVHPLRNMNQQTLQKAFFTGLNPANSISPWNYIYLKNEKKK